MGFLITVGCHMGTRSDLLEVLGMLTDHPARILRVEDYGLDVGSRADLVVWGAERAEDVIAAEAGETPGSAAGRSTDGPQPLAEVRALLARRRG